MLFLAGCQAKLDDLQVVLDRHAKAVAKLPADEQSELLPYGEALGGGQAEDLLPADILTLEAAREIAVRANPDVHAAQARLQAAAARVDEARSRYFPGVVFTQNATRTFQTPANRNRLSTIQPAPIVPSDLEGQNLAITALLNAIRRPLFGTGGRGDTNSFSEHASAFTMSWTVFDGLIREASVLAAKHVHEASKDSLVDVQRLIVRAVDTAYYQVQLAHEHLRIAEAAESFSNDQLRETEKLKNAGRATAADVDNFRIRVLSAQAEVTAADRVRETGRVALAELMGLADTVIPTELQLSALADESAADLAPVAPEPWIGQALAQRPDVEELEELLKAEEESVRAAKGAYSPSVTASGSWGFDRSSNLHYNEDDQSSAAAIELRWELFTGGAREARVREAESNRAEAAAQLNRLRLAVQAEVRRSVIDLANAQTQIRLHRETVTTALENRRVVQAGYLAGKETLNRLNEAQRDYITSDADLALARIRLRQAWTDLHAASAATSP